MIFGVYAYYDKKSKNFLQLQVHQNEPVAMRQFALLIEDDTTLMHKFPEDFDLYEVGTYDSVSGSIEPNAVPELIITGVDIKDGEYIG